MGKSAINVQASSAIKCYDQIVNLHYYLELGLCVVGLCACI